MGMTIGIDIGGSTTKIIGFSNNKVISPMLVKATDPISSLYGAFGKFLNQNSLKLDDISHVMITGVGSSYVQERIFGIPTGQVDEFRSVGFGGLFLSNLENAVVVSMGTGTAFVKAEKSKVRHLGGTGVGGGTLLGLSNRMLNIRHFDDLVEMAKGGNLSNVDLFIKDMSNNIIPGLPPDTTASNFGKISDLVTNPDIALGIINLVFQTIGVLSIFAAKMDGTSDIVLTGNLTHVPQAGEIFNGLTILHSVRFHVPEHAEYATAVGAALLHDNGADFIND
ncbi:MAG: type II pantothenate kinase [Clostridiaceae bacterium]|nr:type II pantothenate kinase [Clostridiaceae bacterium]